MQIAQQTGFETAQREVRPEISSRDLTIMLGYVAFSIVLVIVMYLDAMSAGTAAGDFATMTVFP